jgi:hypothetical protein
MSPRRRLKTSALVLPDCEPSTARSSQSCRAAQALERWDRSLASKGSGAFVNEPLALVRARFVTQ